MLWVRRVDAGGTYLAELVPAPASLTILQRSGRSLQSVRAIGQSLTISVSKSTDAQLWQHGGLALHLSAVLLTWT
jgi:hypothetical protein